MVVFTVSPILLFIAVLGEPTFRFLFTEKWLPAVSILPDLMCYRDFVSLACLQFKYLKCKGKK